MRRQLNKYGDSVMIIYNISAVAPTVYQLSSIRSFNLEVFENADGSFSIDEDFGSKEDAKQHLIFVAEQRSENETELNEKLSDIEKYGQLTIDAVTARISEVKKDY